MKTQKNARRIFGALTGLSLCAGVLAGCGGAQDTAAQNTAPAAANNGATSQNAAPQKLANAKLASAKSAGAKDAGANNLKSIEWASSFEAAREEAKAQNKALMIDFYTDWCGACKMLDAEIYPDAAVVQASRAFVNVKINAEKRTDVAQQYGVTAFPTILWIRADGVPVLRQDGASAEPAHMVEKMKSAGERYAALKP